MRPQPKSAGLPLPRHSPPSVCTCLRGVIGSKTPPTHVAVDGLQFQIRKRPLAREQGSAFDWRVCPVVSSDQPGCQATLARCFFSPTEHPDLHPLLSGVGRLPRGCLVGLTETSARGASNGAVCMALFCHWSSFCFFIRVVFFLPIVRTGGGQLRGCDRGWSRGKIILPSLHTWQASNHTSPLLTNQVPLFALESNASLSGST